jgi:uncharacterized protein
MISHDRALLLFARNPKLGEVKTRLTPRFTPQEALQLHEALLADSLDLLNRCGAQARAVTRLYLSEAGKLGEEVASHLGSAETMVQRGRDLGERLLHAFRQSQEEGYSGIVVLGSDSPHLPDSYVSRAFEALSSSDMVVGPARDGGYYLLGASRLHESLLAGMPWGTAQLYRETVRKARKEAVSLASLPAWYDVDLPETVQQLWSELSRRHSQSDSTLPQASFRLLQAWARDGRIP